MNAKEMKGILNKYTAECKLCNWKGSKYRLLISLKGNNLCPICDSANTIVHLKAKTK